jgi:hypothetical protein
MENGWASASLAFRANNAGIMKGSVRSHHIRAADVAEIVEVAKIVGGYLNAVQRRSGMRDYPQPTGISVCGKAQNKSG